jgi:antitoxin component of MazEF toxin-antitoxin module
VTETFPARVRKSGTSKIVTIPEAIASKFVIGETVYVEISKDTESENEAKKRRKTS